MRDAIGGREGWGHAKRVEPAMRLPLVHVVHCVGTDGEGHATAEHWVTQPDTGAMVEVFSTIIREDNEGIFAFRTRGQEDELPPDPKVEGTVSVYGALPPERRDAVVVDLALLALKWTERRPAVTDPTPRMI